MNVPQPITSPVEIPKLNASARIMYETALEMGIDCTVFGDKETILMKKDGHQWYTRGARTSFQSSVGKTIADKKYLTKLILKHFQLPTAQSIELFQPADSQKLTQLQFPIVLKPTDERYGKGVMVDIKSQVVAETIIRQPQIKFPILAEEMLIGTEYRIICVDYRFVAAAYRHPAHVVGDGQHTIRQLIEIKNQHPWRGKGHASFLTLIEVDQLVMDYLTEQNVQLDTVLEAGKEVKLRKTANLSTGGEAWDVTEEVSPDNRALFEQIARVCDLSIVGIDIMCQSLKEPIVSQPKAGVIEVNASPGLRMHHYPIKGESRNVAKEILQGALKHVQHS